MLAFAKLASLSTLVASLSLTAVAAKHGSPRRRHSGTTSLETYQSHVNHKRTDNARMTFYETGLGACGKTNSDSDFIVALNSPQYGSGGHCFDTITISYGGKSTQAQIVDECPGCPEGGLDLSPGLFSFFASEDAGVIYGSWNFGGAAQKPSPTPTPTPTPKPSPTPKTTSTPPPPSTSEKKTTTSSSATPSSSSSSSSASSSSSSSSASSAAVVSSFASSSASATPSPSVNPAAGLDSLNDAFLGMVILAASQ